MRLRHSRVGCCVSAALRLRFLLETRRTFDSDHKSLANARLRGTGLRRSDRDLQLHVLAAMVPEKAGMREPGSAKRGNVWDPPWLRHEGARSGSPGLTMKHQSVSAEAASVMCSVRNRQRLFWARSIKVKRRAGEAFAPLRTSNIDKEERAPQPMDARLFTFPTPVCRRKVITALLLP